MHTTHVEVRNSVGENLTGKSRQQRLETVRVVRHHYDLGIAQLITDSERDQFPYQRDQAAFERHFNRGRVQVATVAVTKARVPGLIPNRALRTSD